MVKEFLWSQKYRPQTIDDCILPDELKATFKGFVAQGNVPDMILAGTAGIGKTTVAKALCEELGCSYMLINASLNGNIDTLRNDIQRFASTMSLEGTGRKVVILDEADYLNPVSTQPALRSFMETFSKNCGFIMTCNFENRLLEPLRSRSPVIHFKLAAADKPEMAKQFYQRLTYILKEEGVEYDKNVLIELIKNHMPDWRSIINKCQQYAGAGKIDVGIFAANTVSNFDTLIALLKSKKFTEVRKWVGENVDAEPAVLFRNLYNVLYDILEPKSIPVAVLTLADYQYKGAFVADQEINMMAMLAVLMSECDFK